MGCKPQEEVFDWDYYGSLIRHYYHVDPGTLTWGQFLAYMKQIPGLRLFLAGKGRKGGDITAMTPEEWAQAVMEGRIKPDMGPDSPQIKAPASYDPQIAKENELLGKLGIFRP